jgi:hypothetical protein
MPHHSSLQPITAVRFSDDRVPVASPTLTTFLIGGRILHWHETRGRTAPRAHLLTPLRLHQRRVAHLVYTCRAFARFGLVRARCEFRVWMIQKLHRNLHRDVNILRKYFFKIQRSET